MKYLFKAFDVLKGIVNAGDRSNRFRKMPVVVQFFRINNVR